MRRHAARKDTTMYEQIQSHQIAGLCTSYGIERQLWSTPRGPREQYAVTVPRPVPGNQCVAERTIHETEAAAREAWGVRLPEPMPGVLCTIDGFTLTWESPLLEEHMARADDLARWAGAAAVAAHEAWVAAQPEGRHYRHCCDHARETADRDMYAFAMELPIDQLRARHAREIEDRAVERARAEGLLP